MPSLTFLYVLAGLTVLAGVALAVMLAKRRRPGRAKVEETRRVRLEEYALPAEFEDDEESEDDLVEAKICPRCGARYRYRHRFCEHDDAELAALN